MKKPNLKNAILLCLISGLLVACDESQNTWKEAPLLANQSGRTEGAKKVARSDGPDISGRSANRRSIGTDSFLGDSSSQSGADLVQAESGGAFTLNLVNVPIEQAAKAVLGDALKKSYTIDPKVSGNVTLETTRPLSGADLLQTFQTILEFSGAVLETSGNVIKIVPLAGATPHFATSESLGGSGARVVAVPLKYISTTEMVRLLDPITGESLKLQSIANRNILLISGSRDEINSAVEAINLFDVDVLKGKSVGLYKLRAAEPEAVVEELNSIFETTDGGSLQNVVSFIPSQRLGAVLVVTSRSSYLAEAEKWIHDLDGAAGGAKRRPVVYNLQNRAAADLAPILSDMMKDVAEGDTATLEGSPRVAADDAKNAIIVWGNDSEQDSFSRLIQSLDTTPVQVLLEATIAEVSLNDELAFGLRSYFEDKGNSGTFTDASNGSVTSTFPGLSFMFSGTNSAVALNALNSITNVNVVSSPSLMVVDNQEAKLQIGDQVPIATQQTQESGTKDAPVINTISFRDTGIILTVKPRVSSGGQVVLDIEQEVSSVSNTTTSGIDSPTISQRKIKTSVVVTDGQTLALGGLIEDRNNRTTAGAPGISKVPVLGALFRNRKDKRGRTELLILITPKVIRDGHEAESVTAELRQRIQGANGIIGGGISDPGVGHRIVD